MTTMRSPVRISSSPPGRIVSSPRMIAATFESGGMGAWRSGTPSTSLDASSSTSNSPSCTWPSAKTSVCRAAGIPTIRLIAWAVSSSDETTKSTSSWPSRQRSTYSVLDVRITVVALSASRRANMPATRFTSSRDVQAITRSAVAIPAAAMILAARSVALEDRDVEASAQRLKTGGSVSRTVTSCSSWRASTMVEPTCPAPMTKTRTSA